MTFAHTSDNGPWEELEQHLGKVAALAEPFADTFGAASWGRMAGAWHDLGKFSQEFQQYLQHCTDPDAGEESAAPGRVDHSTFGAQYAAAALPGEAGQIIAFCIAGHHAGLADATAAEEAARGSSLAARLVKAVPAVILPADVLAPASLRLPFKPHPTEVGLQVALFTRMLFSCLIDADRSATEAFCDPARAAERRRLKPTVGQLAQALELSLRDKQANAKQTPVNRLRAVVLDDCLKAAALAPGFFSLDVPTGGGKTLSSLAFALRHAEHHHLRRVVVAIPFTSIIEQTADVYRRALGEHAALGLVEHHSNIDPTTQTLQTQMAAENWDAPLIVTTNVQLYESLFAAGTSACRKLHRLAKSVIVLDEAQTIPIELLTPTLIALRRLVEDYGCSIVLCTATQPALRSNSDFKIGIDPQKLRDIIPVERALHAALKRVEVTRLGKLSDDELADRLANESRVLCVVNTRPHASKIFDAMVARVGAAGCYHLSTFMCAQHRRDTLVEIRQRLKAGLACRLVSTQLIEAGVDVDFPCVYRAAAGFDSIAQAAGRCNREGSLDMGRVYVFESDQLPPAGLLRHAASVASELAPTHPDPLAPSAVNAYFRHLYWMQSHAWDKWGVMPCFAYRPDVKCDLLPLQFRTAATKYQIIRDEQSSIVVPYDEEAKVILTKLFAGEVVDYALLRRAQRYIVGVRETWLRKLADAHVIIPHDSGLWLLANESAYSPEKGMSFNSAGFDPAVLMV